MACRPHDIRIFLYIWAQLVAPGGPRPVWGLRVERRSGEGACARSVDGSNGGSGSSAGSEGRQGQRARGAVVVCEGRVGGAGPAAERAKRGAQRKTAGGGAGEPGAGALNLPLAGDVAAGDVAQDRGGRSSGGWRTTRAARLGFAP